MSLAQTTRLDHFNLSSFTTARYLRVARWQSRTRAGQGADAASAAAQQLVTAALNKGTKDNVTAIVGLFQWQ